MKESRFPPPTAERLAQLIAEAYAGMPGPDAQRLAAMGQRIQAAVPAPTPRRVGRPRTWPWWIIALALGGAATAAYWAGEIWQGSPPAAVEQPAGVETPAAVKDRTRQAPVGQRPSGSPGETEGEPTEAQSPIIYRREAP